MSNVNTFNVNGWEISENGIFYNNQNWLKENQKTKMDFTKLPIGTKVFSLSYGEGNLVDVDKKYEPYPVTVSFEKTRVNYSFDGKLHINDINPTLFLNEFEIPEKAYEIESIPDLVDSNIIGRFLKIVMKDGQCFSGIAECIGDQSLKLIMNGGRWVMISKKNLTWLHVKEYQFLDSVNVKKPNTQQFSDLSFKCYVGLMRCNEFLKLYIRKFGTGTNTNDPFIFFTINKSSSSFLIIEANFQECLLKEITYSEAVNILESLPDFTERK